MTDKPDSPLTPAPHPYRPGREGALNPDLDYVRQRQEENYRVRIHETGQYVIRKGSKDERVYDRADPLREGTVVAPFDIATHTIGVKWDDTDGPVTVDVDQLGAIPRGEGLYVEWRASEEDEWVAFPDRFKSVGGALDFLRTKGVERL